MCVLVAGGGPEGGGAQMRQPSSRIPPFDSATKDGSPLVHRVTKDQSGDEQLCDVILGAGLGGTVVIWEPGCLRADLVGKRIDTSSVTLGD